MRVPPAIRDLKGSPDLWFIFRRPRHRASDNFAVTGYELQIDDRPKVVVDELERFWSFGALQPGTSHVIRVNAFDAAGNRGPAATLNFTTTS